MSHQSRVPVPATGAAPEVAAPDGDRQVAAAPVAVAPVPGLTVGHADDPAEHRADALADQALARFRRSATRPEAGSGGGLDSAVGGDSDGGRDAHLHGAGCGHLRRSAAPSSAGAVGREGGVLDGDATASIEAARGTGAPLPTAVRRRMEEGFGRGLGHVRVHAGPQAARLSAAMSAEAFTTGSDIFFGAGRFAPDTPEGERVLAHEIAHVVTEPAGVRRLFGRKKDPAKEAAKEARKREEADRAAKAKQSKVTEKAELKGLKASRARGVAGREALRDAIYDESGDAPVAVAGKVDDKGHVPLAASGPAQRVASLHEEFEAALEREKEVFDQLKAQNKGGSDEKRADVAYQQVWYDEYAHLNAVRPPRETAAERLVIQVRHSRTEAGVQESAAEADTATLKTKMLPKDVQAAYEQMVTHRDDLLEKDPTASRALASEEAREAVLKTVTPKTLAGLPPKDGPVDVAAWQQAEGRVRARVAQKARDASSIEASLALLPAGQRTGTPTEQAGSTAASAGEKVKKAQDYVGIGGKVVNTLGGGIAGQVGKGQDKDLRDAQGITKNKELRSGVPGFLDQGVGEAMTAGERADKQLKSGQRSWVDQKLPQSDATKVKAGFGQVTGILNGLMSAATSAFQMVSSIQKAWESKDPYEGLKATKAGATGLDGLVSAAKNSANLAKLIDSGVSDGVAQVVPGLDIAATALSMVKGVMDVATTGMRQRETDLTMFEARVGSTDKVNVMVYPLMKVSQVYTKHLEQNCWALGVSVLNFSTAVAQVASAGGFGIPAAIKAATAVVDNLHKIAHYIASKVLNAMSKRAEKESAVLHLEGGAEDELRRHPKMAVDGIVLKAAAGDPVALMFLSNYRIGGKPITHDYVKRIKPKPVKPFDPSAPEGDTQQTSDDALLLKIREVVLAGMETNADPQSVFEDLKAKAKPVVSKLVGIKEAWSETGELAQERNALAADGRLGDNTKTDRGLGWRIKQLFASSNRGKLKQRTAAFGAAERLPDGVVCAVGDLVLPTDASPPQITAFLDGITVEDLEAELARTPRRNSPEWTAFLREALVTKLKEQAAAAAKANGGKP